MAEIAEPLGSSKKKLKNQENKVMRTHKRRNRGTSLKTDSASMNLFRKNRDNFIISGRGDIHARNKRIGDAYRATALRIGGQHNGRA